jgi:hypothetical protein
VSTSWKYLPGGAVVVGRFLRARSGAFGLVVVGMFAGVCQKLRRIKKKKSIDGSGNQEWARWELESLLARLGEARALSGWLVCLSL